MIEVLKKIGIHLKEKVPDFGGALVFGSLVEKKLGRPSKDIDVIAMTLGSAWETAVFSINGQAIELFLRRFDRICNSVMASRDFFDTRNVAAGRVIGWPGQHLFFPKLKRIAEVNWPKGPLRPRESSHLVPSH